MVTLGLLKNILVVILFIKRKNISSQFNQTEETALNNENIDKIAYKEYIKIKISLVIIVLFFSKFILIWIFELYQAVSDSVINVQSVNIIVSFLQYVNTVIDPILYFYIINYL